MSSWPLARVVPLPGNGYGLEILTGATPAEIATVAAGLPPAAFIDHTSLDGGTTLLFRRFPRGVPDPSAPDTTHHADPDAQTVADGWTPDVTGMPDRGLTPYQVAVGTLLTATDDPAIGARIFGLIQREDPNAVIALASITRPPGCHCQPQ
ncbi:hypothetical protein [Pseudofrankia sp. DC12]|uniref:hypothetical protein n=1 Tax=Pseudofrankia sp. DC12 TaxID=683315 RepID=UPI0009FD455F|nr:hypothetical protein [Pseudofrankia sp. DC12]